MKIKSRVWHWLAVACGSVGLVLGMGAEGAAQTGGAINGNTYLHHSGGAGPAGAAVHEAGLPGTGP